MTSPLDEKALKAAAEAVAGSLSGYVIADCETIIRAYLSTAPALDELEVVAYAEILAGRVTAVRLDKGRHCIHGVVLASQAHSAIAALRAEIDRLENRAEVADYKLGQQVNEIQPMIISRAETAETERDALRKALERLTTGELVSDGWVVAFAQKALEDSK